MPFRLAPVLMMASAVFMGAVGLVCLFLPAEMSSALGGGEVRLPEVPLFLLQIAGGAYLGFARLNWMSKGATLGGIYGRPLIVGNLMHFVIAAVVLLKVLVLGPFNLLVLLVALAYLVFAAGFSLLLFRPPRG